jgi:hypothetical protein
MWCAGIFGASPGRHVSPLPAALEHQERSTIGPNATVVVRLVGGPADGLVFVVPQRNLPKIFGIGYPVTRYEAERGTGEVHIFRYVAVH